MVPAPAAHPAADSPATPLALDARLGRGGLDRAPCRIVDLSMRGARLRTGAALQGGAHLWLSIPKLGQCAARVARVDGFEADLEFVIPLRQADLDLLAAA